MFHFGLLYLLIIAGGAGIFYDQTTFKKFPKDYTQCTQYAKFNCDLLYRQGKLTAEGAAKCF